MRAREQNSYHNQEEEQVSSPYKLVELGTIDNAQDSLDEGMTGIPNHSHPEFQNRFIERVRQLQIDGRMLEKVNTEEEKVVFDTQLEMVYEYTSRQLGLSWSFETEYDYGWGRKTLPSEDLSPEAYETYQHMMGPGAEEEDKKFLYEYAALTDGDPEEIMNELLGKGWVYESDPGIIKNKYPENVRYIKDFWES